MNCASARLELALLGTGELEPRVEASLWRHLDACGECRSHRDEERALDEALSKWRTAGSRRDIAPEVLAAAGDVAAGGGRPGLLRRRLGPLLAAAAVLIGLALLPFLETGRPAADREEQGLAIARVDIDPVPIGTDLSGLAFPVRNPFRP